MIHTIYPTKIFQTHYQIARGLMFRTYQIALFILDQEQPLVLHMMFVFYPIDVLLLDKNYKVIEMKENFRPFTIYKPHHHGKYIIELPHTEKPLNISCGDIIHMGK